jgi:DNA-binding response OmpR family regulator
MRDAAATGNTATAGRALALTAGMKPKLLVIEDSDVAGNSIQEFFESNGFEVRRVVDRSQAALWLRRGRFAAILTDLRLGDADNVDGLEIVRSARAQQPRAAVVMLSAFVTPRFTEMALVAGADLVLGKSLPLGIVTKIVRDLIDRYAVLLGDTE